MSSPSGSGAPGDQPSSSSQRQDSNKNAGASTSTEFSINDEPQVIEQPAGHALGDLFTSANIGEQQQLIWDAESNAPQASYVQSATQLPTDDGTSTLCNLDFPQASTLTTNDAHLSDDLQSIATPQLIRLQTRSQRQPSPKCNVDAEAYQLTCSRGLPRDGSGDEEGARKHVLRFGCRLCTARFASQVLLDQHVRVHERNQQRRDAKSPTRGILCQVCDLECPDEEALRRHAVLHTYKFVCLLCERRFERDSDLTAHVLTEHPSEQARRPDVPQFVASGGDEPSSKRRATSEAKPICGDVSLVCQWPRCGKTFTHAANLARHMKGHTSEKGFACRSCGMKFLRSDARATHERRKHKKKDADVENEDDEDLT